MHVCVDGWTDGRTDGQAGLPGAARIHCPLMDTPRCCDMAASKGLLGVPLLPWPALRSEALPASPQAHPPMQRGCMAWHGSAWRGTCLWQQEALLQVRRVTQLRLAAAQQLRHERRHATPRRPALRHERVERALQAVHGMAWWLGAAWA